MSASAARFAPERYVAAMCRPRTQNAFAPDGRIDEAVLVANVAEFARCIRKAADEHGARLVVFPEFALSGYSPGDYRSWVEGSLTFPGPVSDRIGEAARAANVYVVVQAPEVHPAIPDRYFLSAAAIGPDGAVAMVHRKNLTLSLRTSPIDIYDRFVEVFGKDALMPVLATPLGTLGIAIAAEVHYPEAVRTLALKGAEVILNPIANAVGVDYFKRPGANVVRSVRAFENVAYLAMTNVHDGDVPPEVWDHTGAAIGNPVDDGLFTLATIDIPALRQYRATDGMNLLAQMQGEIATDLRSLPLWPRNALVEGPAADFGQLCAIEREVWRNLCEAGHGVLPGA